MAMVKKKVKPIRVKKVIEKSLKEKLLIAVIKILDENKSELTPKIHKVVNKSVKRITKKVRKSIG